MICSVGRIILYVDSPEKMVEFWVEKVGFSLVGENAGPGNTQAFEIAPAQNSETRLVLLDRAAVSEMEPEMNMGTPSILFSCKDIQTARADLENKGIQTGLIVEMQGIKTTNFCDPENNWYAMREI